MEQVNLNSWDDAAVYDMTVHALKASKYCEAQRKAFVIARATPVGKIGDPTYCEDKVANFLNCFHELKKKTNARCKTQHTEIIDCLKTNGKKNDSVCRTKLDNFINCD